MVRVGLFRRRPLRALQVEVTTRCTRSCALCPRHALAGCWRSVDLSADAWAAIVPALPQAEHVHLQGWGEPLLHPDLPRMAADAKRARCSVGITSNGEPLGDAISWLIAQRVDLVTVSVGGTEHHAALRGGLNLDEALRAAGELSRARRAPRVQVSFLLTRDNAGELEAIVATAARLGIPEVFGVHLDCTPSAALLEQAAFGEEGLHEGVGDAIRRAEATAERLGVVFRPPARQAEDVISCALDPSRFAFVSADGRVGPCVYLLLPIEGPIPRHTATGSSSVDAASYGHLADADLPTILAGASRRRFTAPFAARLAAEHAFRGSLLQDDYRNVAWEQVHRADAARSAALARDPFPPACAGCHKTRGW